MSCGLPLLPLVAVNHPFLPILCYLGGHAQQEEEKAAKKIALTRERAARIVQLREENEKRMAAKAAEEVRVVWTRVCV